LRRNSRGEIMNCKHCKYDPICGDKEYWEKEVHCDDFEPEEWVIAKAKYEKELQSVGEKL